MRASIRPEGTSEPAIVGSNDIQIHGSFETHLNVDAHQTALTNLKELVAAGLLARQRDGRGYVFLPVADLARRVADGPAADPRQAPLFE